MTEADLEPLAGGPGDVDDGRGVAGHVGDAGPQLHEIRSGHGVGQRQGGGQLEHARAGIQAGQGARRFAGMSSDVEKSAARQQVRQQVEAVYGEGAAKEAAAVLQQWRSRSPKAVDALINADYLSDPRVYGQLITRGRINAARKGLK